MAVDLYTSEPEHLQKRWKLFETQAIWWKVSIGFSWSLIIVSAAYHRWNSIGCCWDSYWEQPNQKYRQLLVISLIFDSEYQGLEKLLTLKQPRLTVLIAVRINCTYSLSCPWKAAIFKRWCPGFWARLNSSRCCSWLDAYETPMPFRVISYWARLFVNFLPASWYTDQSGVPNFQLI